MKRQLQILMLPEDEKELSALIVEDFPAVRFVDDSIWQSAEPPSVGSIHECRSRYAFIWDTSRFPSLPSERLEDGRFVGPSAGPVVQVVRSAMKDGALATGRIAAGTDESDPGHVLFIEAVFQLVRKLTSPAIARGTGKRVANIRVGRAASVWAKEGNILRHHSTVHQYLPEL